MAISLPGAFTSDNSRNYIVSIRLWSGGLSFSGYDPLIGDSFFYREAEFDRTVSYISSLKDFFFAHEFFSWTFKRTYVISVSPLYTLVPVDTYLDERKDQLLAFNFSRSDGHCLKNRLMDDQVELLFGMNEDVYEFCSRSLLFPLFIHHMTPLLSLWKKQGRSVLPKRMYVMIGRKQMDVACYAQEDLLFMNTFQTDHPDDILYYILYVWKQIGLDQQKDQLQLFGESAVRTWLTTRLRTYLRHIQPMEVPSEAYLLGSEVVKAPMDLLSLISIPDLVADHAK